MLYWTRWVLPLHEESRHPLRQPLCALYRVCVPWRMLNRALKILYPLEPAWDRLVALQNSKETIQPDQLMTEKICQDMENNGRRVTRMGGGGVSPMLTFTALAEYGAYRTIKDSWEQFIAGGFEVSVTSLGDAQWNMFLESVKARELAEINKVITPRKR